MRDKRMSASPSKWPRGRLTGLGALLLTLLVLGAGCSSLKFWTTAKSHADLQVRPASGDTARLLRNAHYLSLMGRRDMALKELEEAYQQDPHNLKVVDALARGYEEVGRWERAQQVYQEALSRDGSNPVLYNNLCYSYYLAGHFQKAEACFRQALAQDPQNVAARNNLGLLLCRTGRGDEARRLWQAAEGEVAAEKKMKELRAFLGGEGPGTYARPASEKSKQVAARPEAEKPPEATKPASGQARSVSPPQTAVASVKPAPDPAPAPRKETAPEPAPAKAGPAPQPVAGAKTAPPPAASPVANAAAAKGPRERQRPLTVQELTETNIRVENGNGFPHLARDTRDFLWGEGFNVVSIRNYLDFGVEDTVIYSRPQAARLAKVLGEKFFHTANVKVNEELPEDIDVRVIMGHDLLLKEDLLAKLAG
jgi:Tfp pilus assembly protein PilF